MSSTNNVKNSVIPASQSGQVDSNANWRHVRTTAEAVTWTTTTTNSSEIQQSRNLQDVVDIGAQGGGTVAAELHTPTADTDANTFLQSLMGGTFSTSRVKAPSGLTISVDASGVLYLSAKAYQPDTIVFVDGFSAGINGPWLVSNAADGTGINGTRPGGFTPKPYSFPVASQSVPVGRSVEAIGSKLTGAITISVNNGVTSIDFGLPVGINVGTWFNLQNVSNPANAGFYRASAVNGNVITCSTAPVGSTGETGTTNSYLFIGADLRNGTNVQWFNMNSVNYGDDGSALAKIRTGMRVGQSQFSFDASNIATVTHTLMGMTETVQESDPGTSDITVTSRALSSRANVAMISANMKQLSGMSAVKTLTLTVTNNLRAQTGLGSFGLVGIGDGTFTVTGSLSAYFQTAGLYNAFMSGAYVPLHWGIGKDGSYVFFSLPKCKITSAQNSAKGLNQDLTDDINFTAMQADDGVYTMQIAYFAWVGNV